MLAWKPHVLGVPISHAEPLRESSDTLSFRTYNMIDRAASGCPDTPPNIPPIPLVDSQKANPDAHLPRRRATVERARHQSDRYNDQSAPDERHLGVTFLNTNTTSSVEPVIVVGSSRL